MNDHQDNDYQSDEFGGKVCLISGSSQGIGRVSALQFAASGAKVAVVASSDRTKADKVAGEIADAGGTALAFVANLARPDDCRSLVDKVVDAWGTVDILVNSAGVHYATFVGDTTENEFDRMCDVNFKGAYFLIDAVTPVMKANSGGKIVNVTAQMANLPMATMAIYCATKSALQSLTAAMAWELAPHGINCNAVAPGNTLPPEYDDFLNNTDYADVVEWFKSSTPSQRKVSYAADIANVIEYLCSSRASSLYGETIVADEGAIQGWNGYLPNGLAIFPDASGKRRTRE